MLRVRSFYSSHLQPFLASRVALRRCCIWRLILWQGSRADVRRVRSKLPVYGPPVMLMSPRTWRRLLKSLVGAAPGPDQCTISPDRYFASGRAGRRAPPPFPLRRPPRSVSPDRAARGPPRSAEAGRALPRRGRLRSAEGAAFAVERAVRARMGGRGADGLGYVWRGLVPSLGGGVPHGAAGGRCSRPLFPRGRCFRPLFRGGGGMGNRRPPSPPA